MFAARFRSWCDYKNSFYQYHISHLKITVVHFLRKDILFTCDNPRSRSKSTCFMPKNSNKTQVLSLTNRSIHMAHRNDLLSKNKNLTLPSRCICGVLAPIYDFSFSHPSLLTNIMKGDSFLMDERTSKLSTKIKCGSGGILYRRYSDSNDQKMYLDNLLQNVLNSETRGASRDSLHLIRKHQRRQRAKEFFENDEKEVKPLTVEKQLLNLMEMWKMDEAVDLLVESLKNGFTPNSGVILNLLQQLGHLGEVNNILELHDEFLKDKNITREVKFYKILTDAYCNSGRVEESVALLRINYHKTLDFDDIDPFFTMVSIMIMQNFEHHFYLIKDFIHDLLESDRPVEKAQASLWKCLVLTERFDQADVLLDENEMLVKFIPSQVSEIIHAPFYITYNKDVVLTWLTRLPHIKSSLKSVAFEALIEHKCKDNRWQEAFESLRDSMIKDEAFVKQSTLTLFLGNFLSQLSDKQVAELEAWADSLDEFDTAESHSDDAEDKES